MQLKYPSTCFNTECETMAGSHAVIPVNPVQPHDNEERTNSPGRGDVAVEDRAGDMVRGEDFATDGRHAGGNSSELGSSGTCSSDLLAQQPLGKIRVNPDGQDVIKADVAGKESPTGNDMHDEYPQSNSGSGSPTSCFGTNNSEFQQQTQPGKHHRACPTKKSPTNRTQPPPKLPPKPPHLLPGGSSPILDQVVVRDRRAVSASVVAMPQTEDKTAKKPVPRPRKSLPNIFDNLSSVERKSIAMRPSVSPDSGPLEEEMSAKKEPKNPRKKTMSMQHVRVRDRTRIFEKMIEEETRVRASQPVSGEPRSRSSSRSSEHSDIVGKFQDDVISPIATRRKGYVKLPLTDTQSCGASSDDVFTSPTFSLGKSPHRQTPSPNLHEDEALRKGDEYTDVVVSDLGRTTIEPSRPKVTLADSPKSLPHQLPPKPKTSIPSLSLSSSSRSANDKLDRLSPESQLSMQLMPYIDLRAYRNISPQFELPPKPALPHGCKVKQKSEVDTTKQSNENGDVGPSKYPPEATQRGGDLTENSNFVHVPTSKPHSYINTVLPPTTDESPTAEVAMEPYKTSSESKSSDGERIRKSKMHSYINTVLPTTAGEAPTSEVAIEVSKTLSYEFCLPGNIDPSPLRRNIGTLEVGYSDHEMRPESELQSSDYSHDSDGSSEMLCNRSRRQRHAVKARHSNQYSNRGWQHESSPAALGSHERQSPITQDAISPSDDKRHSEVSSVGSTISSLISNVSSGIEEHLSSDDADYEDVMPPDREVIPLLPPDGEVIPLLPPDGEVIPLLPPDGEVIPLLPPDGEVIPLLPPDGKTIPLLPLDGKAIPLLPPDGEAIPLLPPDGEAIPLLPPDREAIPLLPPDREAIPLLPPDQGTIPFHPLHTKEETARGTVLDMASTLLNNGDHDGDNEIYSNLPARLDWESDCRNTDSLPTKQNHEKDSNDAPDKEAKNERSSSPVEIEMQLLRSKSPRSPDKDNRRKAFELHIPLFLKNSSSVESTPSSAAYTDCPGNSSVASHSEDSEGDYTDDAPSSFSVVSSRPKPSEDSWSVSSDCRVSTDSLGQTVKPQPRWRKRRSWSGDKFVRKDGSASSISTEYSRPVSCISTEYDRPFSSTSADYIGGILDSFHEDKEKEGNDSEGFSYTWTVNHAEEETTQQAETYRPKSEDTLQLQKGPSKYSTPRKTSGPPVAPLPPVRQALKPQRPYSEPSKKAKRNSLSRGKNLLVPSKEEITEQLKRISHHQSRFVSQEPLFQHYQEDARSRDSYLRLMNVSSLETLAIFLEKQETLKRQRKEQQQQRLGDTTPTASKIPDYRVLIPDEEIYKYQSSSEVSNENDRHRLDFEPEDIYQSAEPVYEPPGELFYDTGNLLQRNAIYESGSLSSSTGECSGGSNSSDGEIPKPYGLMQRTLGSTLSGVGAGMRRSYWTELPEVLNSGLLEQLLPEEKRQQEALFEVITSEASYLRSLNLVVEHFSEAITLQPPTGLLNKVQHHRLFSNIKNVRDASEKLLLDLEKRQQDSVIMSDVCDILLQHFDKGGFDSYIMYCANNQYQIKTLEQLRKNASFIEVLKHLESNPACCCLDLQSFLMLPFQRITRLPLLLEAIRQQAKVNSPLQMTAMSALRALRKMAEQCNEEAKRMELIEEVTQLANQLDFRDGVKKMNLSQTTSIVKRGRIHIIKKDSKLLNRGKLIAKTIYVIVFTDKVVICKERNIKGESLKYEVTDWCPRNLVQVECVANPQEHNKLPDGVPVHCKHVFLLSFLQNSQKKEVEFALDTNSEAERQRWMEAMHPAKLTQDGETIYESWDCPQVMCTQPYEAQDRDELSLDIYDRVDIDRKIEGWYNGTRVSDHAKGWFPATYTREIVNDHVLARNLKQRHRLLSLCDQHLRNARNYKK